MTVSNIGKRLVFVFHAATLVVRQRSPSRIIDRFNLPSLQNTLPDDQSNNVISKLHGILKPFLLRRLKADVEHALPPKKEYVLYAPLSERQRGAYDAVLTGALRGYLINGKENETGMKDQITSVDKGRQMRKRKKVSYRVDGDDDEWFKRVENGEFVSQLPYEEELDAGRQFHYKNTGKSIVVLFRTISPILNG